MPLTDTEPPPSEQTPKQLRCLPAAIGWGVACAICAGGVSLSIFLLTCCQIRIANAELLRRLPEAAIVIAGVGAVSGLIAGLVMGSVYADRNKTAKVLGLLGALAGGLGGGFTIQTIIACREWISPLFSPAILWAFVGFLTGVSSYHCSRWMPACEIEEDVPPEPVTATQQFAESRRQQREGCIFRMIAILAPLVLAFLLLAVANTRYLD